MRALFRRLYRKFLAPLVDESIARHLMLEYHVFGGATSRLDIDPTASVMNALFNVSSGTIRVERNVTFGHNVCVLTGRHDVASRGPARQGQWPPIGCDIVIREGAWLASNVTVVGPAEIGAHAVIAAGAVVRGTIPPGVLAGGVPAQVIKEI